MLILLAGAPAAIAAPAAREAPEGITLENGVVSAFFPAKDNYTLSGFRRLPDGRNVLEYCLIGYSVEGAKYWFQDNKSGEYGLRPVTTRIERGPDLVRLTITYAAAGEPRHFRMTKTHTLREGSAVLENRYQLEAPGPMALKGGVSLPLIRFAPHLTHAAAPRGDGSLMLGDSAAIRRDEGSAPWVGAYEPATGEGVAFCLPGGEPQAGRDGAHVRVSVVAPLQGKVVAGAKAETTFALAAFAARPVPAALAAALTGAPGIPAPVRFGRVYDMASDRFDFADLSLWEKYRGSVRRPASFIKPADLQRARENVRRHPWAQALLSSYRGRSEYVLKQPAGFIEKMISETTPLCTLFTMCPACEYAPIHGQYSWSLQRPDEMRCKGCGTVYPNAKYTEDMVLVTRHGGEQRFSFYGGKSWDFNGIALRSSWSGAIRAYKNEAMARAARDLAMVYALTGERAYGEKAAAILSRFAAVYPGYLLHSGYGEIADMDPRVAAAQINTLPEEETNCPPNKKDRKLHAGYWMAGRGFSAVGMEGGHIARLAEAYDLVADLIPDADRRRIEKDLLLEGTYLLLCDPGLNNKTATNRSAVGEVGMAVGEPRRVRFGLSGLRWFINEWYLTDGAASESPGYGNMTLAGIWEFADALHGYSDPPGYQDAAGRLDNLDIYGEARYRSVFQVLVDALLPSLTYPPVADSYLTTGPMREVVEVMATRYPSPRFRALLAEMFGGDFSTKGGEWALFHRPPDGLGGAAALSLPDHFFPAWKLGYLRSGKDGRRGAAVISASDWGGHHHLDSLNLFFWQDGQELLSDLGYLWDNPDKHHLGRTVAHNLVVVDEGEQRTEGRGGWLRGFDASPRVKVIEVASDAYPQAQEYRRTTFQIEHPNGVYLADIFRAAGGKTHDYVFHGPNMQTQLDGFTGAAAPDLEAYHFTHVRTAGSGGPWRADWTLKDGLHLQALSLPQAGEESLLAVGWGQRAPTDKGATLPYVVRRTAGKAGAAHASAFSTVFEGYKGEALVKAAHRIETGVPGVVALAVDLADGGTDYVVSAPEGKSVSLATPAGPLTIGGGLALVATKGKSLRFASVVGCARLSWGPYKVALDQPVLRGKVMRVANEGADCWLELDRPLPNPQALAGRTILAGRGEKRTGYAIRGIEGTKVFVRRAGEGVDAGPADNWEFALSAALEGVN